MEWIEVGGWAWGHGFVVVFCAAAEELLWFGAWLHCFEMFGMD